jgi:hypothetical protein
VTYPKVTWKSVSGMALLLVILTVSGCAERISGGN